MTQQKIYSGLHSSAVLADILREHSPKKILCVTGKQSYQLSGAENIVGAILHNYNCVRFSEYGSYPRIEDVQRGLEQFKDAHCDMVVGIGGGAAIDIAKSIAFAAEQNSSIKDLIAGTAETVDRQIPLVAIPTTAGTGSESTHFAVVYIDKEKQSLVHRSMTPDHAILDSRFTKSLPKYQAACAVMDALCQGIESFWSVKSTEESRSYSRKAIELIMSNIDRCYDEYDATVRSELLEASNYSGRAINIANTTAAHALSYPLTAYFDVPHGHAVAMNLPALIEWNSRVSVDNVNDGRGVEYVKDTISQLCDTLGVSGAAEARNRLECIISSAGLNMRLSQCGVGEDQVEFIVAAARKSGRMGNNPVKMTDEMLHQLLRECL